jgi:hypothetical protein
MNTKKNALVLNTSYSIFIGLSEQIAKPIKPPFPDRTAMETGLLIPSDKR